MLKFVTSILNSCDSGKGNSLTACERHSDYLENESRIIFSSPVWESFLDRLGSHQTLCQSAATWSTGPRKVFLQGAPKNYSHGQSLKWDILNLQFPIIWVLPSSCQSLAASPCLSQWSGLCGTSSSSPGHNNKHTDSFIWFFIRDDNPERYLIHTVISQINVLHYYQILSYFVTTE